jgi:hypothetical protein
MAARIVKELKGHSGSAVYLMTKHSRLFVRKTGDFKRNINQLQKLVNYNVPQVYSVTSNFFDMEYIHGLDMRSFLINYPAEALVDFLIDVLCKFSEQAQLKDYTATYVEFLSKIDYSVLPFTQQQFLPTLPTHLPCGTYHGDLTLENLIYSNQEFYMIDCSEGLWDSYVFDIAKLRQDLECKWFLRENPAMLENKLAYIQDKIFKHFPISINQSLLILMLLRVLRYCKVNDDNWNFLIKEINKLWK